MKSEIEATFIDADLDHVRAELKAAGAKLIYPERLMRRENFDFPGVVLDQKPAWLRLRTEGDKITLTYKERQAETIEGMKEIMIEVNDFEQAKELLFAIGLVTKSIQETKRELWRLDDCEIMLDTWPWIPSYVEVEGPSEMSVKATSEELGFTWSAAVFDSADNVYQNYFDVTRTEISTVLIEFGPVPDWLEAKRRG